MQEDTDSRLVEYAERRKTDGLPVVVNVGDKPPVALSLHYNMRFALSRVVPGPALTSDDMETIAGRLASLTKVSARPIFRRVLYTSVPAYGYWSYQGPFGEILLLPPPPDAPRIEWVLGHHPIVLEFAVEECGDTSVDQQRRERAAREIGLVLSGVHGQIHVPDRWPEQQWVMVEKEAVYARPGYETYGQGENGLPGMRNDFSPVHSLQPLRVVDHERFYERRGIGPDDHKLSVPDSLGDSLDRVARLPPGQKRDLIRACFWLNHARRVWTISQSASYLAVSQAIEALLPDAEQMECQECGEVREVPSITKRFTEWVEANVPDEEARSSLYANRSKITHGSMLLEMDVHGFPGGLTPLQTEQDLALGTIWRAARLGLVNWLRSEDR
jgi:hypothetical protein